MLSAGQEQITHLAQLLEIMLDADQPSEAAWSQYLVAKEDCENLRLQVENGYTFMYNHQGWGSVPSPDQA